MIKKKSNILFIFGFLFSIFIIPSDVFASENYTTCEELGVSSWCPTIDSSQSLIHQAKRLEISYMNLLIDGVEYKSYFLYSDNKSSSYRKGDFDSDSFGFSLTEGDPMLSVMELHLGNWIWFDDGMDKVYGGWFEFDDILQQFPYFSLIKNSTNQYPYVLYFTYTDDVVTRFTSSGRFEYMVPYSKRVPNSGGLTFVLAFADNNTKEALFIAVSGGSSGSSNEFYFAGTDSTGCASPDLVGISGYCGVSLDGKKYVPLSGSKILDDSSLNGSFNSSYFNSSLMSTMGFTSNVSLKDESGVDMNYVNNQDISNSSSSSGSAFPTSLDDLLSMIPDLFKDLSKSFGVIGTIFTTAMISFPPIITTGLYSVFILGILILIIKALK